MFKAMALICSVWIVNGKAEQQCFTHMFKWEFESQKDRWYFKKDLQKSFHSNFQSYKKGIKYTEKFRLIQLYKI